jgi:hypothetical protein
MDLLERYLQAIAQYLPPNSSDDTIAELRANLLDQMDARAEELGRPLTEAEVADILRAHGKPEAVALRYLPQRSLIGPAVFPFYLFTLRRALPLVLLVYVIANAIPLITAPSPGAFGGYLLRACLRLIPTLFIFWGCMTLVFAAIDAVLARSAPERWSTWDPTKLSAKSNSATKPRSFARRMVELIIHVLWMIYVLAIPAHPFLIIGPGVYVFQDLGVTVAPVWHRFFVMLIVMLSAQLVVKLLALVPGENTWIKPFDLAADLLGIAALSVLAFAKEILVPVRPLVDLQQLATINHGITLGLRIAFLCAVLGMLAEIWKYARRSLRVDRLAF